MLAPYSYPHAPHSSLAAATMSVTAAATTATARRGEITNDRHAGGGWIAQTPGVVRLGWCCRGRGRVGALVQTASLRPRGWRHGVVENEQHKDRFAA